MKTYYVANVRQMDKIYRDSEPQCLDIKEVERLAREWEMTTEGLLELMHEATPPEIEAYGVYDSATYTVAELVKTLQQCPQDYPVFIRNYEGYNSDDTYHIYSVGVDPNGETVDLFVL